MCVLIMNNTSYQNVLSCEFPPLFLVWHFMIISTFLLAYQIAFSKKYISDFMYWTGNRKCWHFLAIIMNSVEIFNIKFLDTFRKDIKDLCFTFFTLKDVISGLSPLLFRKLSNPDIFSSAGKAKLQRQLSQDDSKLRRGSLASSLSGKYLFCFLRNVRPCCLYLKVDQLNWHLDSFFFGDSFVQNTHG